MFDWAAARPNVDAKASRSDKARSARSGERDVCPAGELTDLGRSRKLEASAGRDTSSLRVYGLCMAAVVLDLGLRRMLLADRFVCLARESDLDFGQRSSGAERYTFGDQKAFHVIADFCDEPPFLNSSPMTPVGKTSSMRWQRKHPNIWTPEISGLCSSRPRYQGKVRSAAPTPDATFGTRQELWQVRIWLTSPRTTFGTPAHHACRRRRRERDSTAARTSHSVDHTRRIHPPLEGDLAGVMDRLDTQAREKTRPPRVLTEVHRLTEARTSRA